MTIKAVAPGKAVLIGEYSVLAGGPAVVLATSSFASISLESTSSESWVFETLGFQSEPELVNPDKLPASSGSSLISAILEKFGLARLRDLSKEGLPPSRIITDSSSFFLAGKKLGLGSSAAVCTASYRLLCQVLSREPNLREAIDIHRTWQGGAGSGLDVAASWHGEIISFQDSESQKFYLPPEIWIQFVWSGKSSTTVDHIRKFQLLKGKRNKKALESLKESSQTTKEQFNLQNLLHYQKTLEDFDEACGLNIFSPEHSKLGTIAHQNGLAYKPCGAGGGDIGVAFGDDTNKENKQRFVDQATSAGFVCLNLETAEHGVKVTT